MAVFTAIATAIVGAFATAGTILGSTLLFNTVVGVVAAGLALGTAKLLGVFEAPTFADARANGSKVQVAPSTDNKIGVAYGTNFMSGPITDVNISNRNQTMSYCITLSEFVEGASYSVGKIFWGDAQLVFGTGASGHIVQSRIDKNSSTNTDWNGKIRMRVYAGGTTAAKQIFPTTNTTAATNMMPHWKTLSTGHYTMEDLVFVMIEVDYDAENGLTGLSSCSWEITCDKDNPGDVLFDYLTNTRYGAGLSNSDIDITSVLGSGNTAMKGYCDEQISYTSNRFVSTTIDRFQTNGYLSTFDTVMDNIDKICRNANTYFTFDGKQGKFKTVPNRPYTTTELNDAFVLDDDNIVSKISITSTELYNLLNAVKINFADRNRRDQTNTVVVETPASDRNSGEPDNELEYRAELLNNNIHAQELANIDLSQSRNGMIVNCSADFSALQIDAGDVVKLTNTDFGFSNKLFRVMRNEEQLGQDGMIVCELLLLEYNEDVYTLPVMTESESQPDNANANITIPTIPGGPGIPGIPQIPPIIFKPFERDVTTTEITGSGSTLTVDVIKDVEQGIYTGVKGISASTDFSVGDSVRVFGNLLGGRTPENDLTFTVDNVAGSGTPAAFNGFGNISGNASVLPGQSYGRYIPQQAIGNIAVGAQIEDTPAANTSASNTDVLKEFIPVRELDFLNGTGFEPGDYSFRASTGFIGALNNPTANFSLNAKVTLENANGQITSTQFGSTFNNSGTIPDIIEASKTITIPENTIRGNVVLLGKNTMDQNSASQVGYNNAKYDWVKLTNGDIF